MTPYPCATKEERNETMAKGNCGGRRNEERDKRKEKTSSVMNDCDEK